jgi:hypothetical protein
MHLHVLMAGIFYRGDSRDQKHAVYEKKKKDFLRIAHTSFSTGVWKINKIWIFLIFY